MRARARIVAVADRDGATRVVELLQAPPLGLRCTPDAVYLVSTAQGLVGDDDLRLEVALGPGARLRICSVAATIAYASRGAAFTVHAEVGEAATLDWRPQPTIVTAGCVARVRADLDVAEGGSVAFLETCLLGRHGEEPGSFEHLLTADYANKPLLRHRIATGPEEGAWNGPAVIGSGRALGLGLFAGDLHQPETAVGEGWAVHALDGEGVLFSGVAGTRVALWRMLNEAKLPG